MNMPPPQIPTTFTKDARPVSEHIKVIEKRIYVKLQMRLGMYSMMVKMWSAVLCYEMDIEERGYYTIE